MTTVIIDNKDNEVAAIEWGEDNCATIKVKTSSGWKAEDIQHFGKYTRVYRRLLAMLEKQS